MWSGLYHFYWFVFSLLKTDVFPGDEWSNYGIFVTHLISAAGQGLKNFTLVPPLQFTVQSVWVCVDPAFGFVEMANWPTDRAALWWFSAPRSTQPFRPDRLISPALAAIREALNTQHSFHFEIMVGLVMKFHLITVSLKVCTLCPPAPIEMLHIVVIHV